MIEEAFVNATLTGAGVDGSDVSLRLYGQYGAFALTRQIGAVDANLIGGLTFTHMPSGRSVGLCVLSVAVGLRALRGVDDLLGPIFDGWVGRGTQLPRKIPSGLRERLQEILWAAAQEPTV